MITYRLAATGDIDPLVSLLVEIMLHHGVTPPPDDALRRVVSDILDTRDHCFLVAVDEERIVAMCALVFSYSTWSASLVCELQDVVVTASCRRRNIGRGLLGSAEALARERGCSRLFLSAESWNLEAQRFYRSLRLAEKAYLYFERDLLG